MSAVRVIWTLALPFVVQHCLTTNQLAPMGFFLALGAVLLLFMLRAGPPQTDLERLTHGFGPMLVGSMTLGIIFVLGGLYLKGNGQLALALPALNNLAFLLVFAGSLAIKRPIIQRFARLFHPDLSEPELVYCTHVTWLWSGFFLLNIIVTLSLAIWAPLHWWTLYTGAASYLIAGTLGLGEYVVRKKRFGRFTNRPHDKLLRRLLGERQGP
jgi:uncharacterized membrane protein